MDKIKKLSQAIRLGSTFKPQGKNVLLYNNQTCAAGAALDALGLLTERSENKDAVVIFSERFETHPSITNRIFLLNDSGRTREKIADWLDEMGL